MSKEETLQYGLYYSVIDGTFRTKVEKDHPGAKMREYKTKDGGKGVKYERIVSALSGYIEEITLYDSDFGRVISVRLDKNEEGRNPIVQLSADTSYGEDFMKKSPNIDFKKEVRFAPYAFENDNGRMVRGISITQDGEKISNFFFDSKTEKQLHGYPEPKGETRDFTKEDWKIYFLETKKFLLKYMVDNVFPRIGQTPLPKNKEEEDALRADYPEENRNPDAIPF